MIELKLVRDSTEFLAMSSSWNELLHNYPNRNLFLTHTWLYHWWKNFGAGKALRVIVFYDDNKLIGAVPLVLYKERLRGLPVTVLGTFFNIHMSRTDLIILPEYQMVVTDKLAEYFAATAREWDVLMLRQMPADSPHLVNLSEGCKRAGLTPFAPQQGIGKCFLPVDSSWEGYIKTRSKHFRKRLKEQCRRVEKLGNVVYRTSNDPGNGEADFQLLQDLEAKSWKAADEFAAMSPEDWRFQKDVALCIAEGIGWENTFMELDGKIIAAVHSVIYDSVIYSFQMIFDEVVRDAYPGRAMFQYLLKTTWQRNEFACFDFNGNSPFCKSWTDREIQYADLHIYNSRPYSLLLTQLKRFVRWMK